MIPNIVYICPIIYKKYLKWNETKGVNLIVSIPQK
jgi:hypothetical protein